MSLSGRRELLAATVPRYKEAGRAEKQIILDEFVTATGYHRKYAITLLNEFDPASPSPTKRERRARHRKYDDDVREALLVVKSRISCKSGGVWN